MWKILTAASTAVVLMGAPAVAQMADFDANDDMFVDQNEFGTGFDGGGIFGDWDTDRDEMLSEDEWNVGFGDDYDENRFGGYTDWDADQSGMLDQNEFNEGVFGGYDEDDDDLWGESEYGAYEDDGWF
jgi:hypothetical protein